MNYVAHFRVSLVGTPGSDQKLRTGAVVGGSLRDKQEGSALTPYWLPFSVWLGRRFSAFTFLALAVLLVSSTSCRKQEESPAAKVTITVYGFSVVGEALEKEIFPAFQKEWKTKTGQDIEFGKSFAGSEIITNQIASGARAELAILAIDRNAARLREQHATKSDWKWLPNGGIVHTSPMIIMVRQGNPKKIKDFKDLAQPGLRLIHPDPISSGAGQWSLIAIYGSEIVKTRRAGHEDPQKAFELLRSIWKNVISTPVAAREARTQFERGEGDALVTYELDALQLGDKGGAKFEIVVPPVTVFSEHPVIVIDHDMVPWKYALVELFARYLWTEEAQKAWVKYYFRTPNEDLNATQLKFAHVSQPFLIKDFGGWEKAYPEIVEKVWKEKIQSVKQ